MHIMAGTVELINLENYGCCLLNLATGEKEFYRGKEKRIPYFTGFYFKFENTFFALYPTENGPIMYYEGQEYKLKKAVNTKLYLVKFHFSKKECYALWYTDDVDGFLLDDNGKIRSFVSEEETRLFANRKGYHLLEYFFRSCTIGKLQVFGRQQRRGC